MKHKTNSLKYACRAETLILRTSSYIHSLDIFGNDLWIAVIENALLSPRTSISSVVCTGALHIPNHLIHSLTRIHLVLAGTNLWEMCGASNNWIISHRGGRTKDRINQSYSEFTTLFFLQDIVNAAWMRLRSKIPTTEFSADGQVSVLPLPDQLQNNERFNCSTKNVNGLLVRTRSSASPPIVCWGEWHKKCNHLRTCQF